MRKNNNVNLAQVKKHNTSRRGIDKVELANRLFHIMCNSDIYQSRNNYEVNYIRVILFYDGIAVESLYDTGSREYYNDDEVFLPIENIPVEYRKVKTLYMNRELNYGEVMWLPM